MGIDTVRELSVVAGGKVFNTNGYGFPAATAKKLSKLESGERWAEFIALSKKQKVESLTVNGGDAKTVAGFVAALAPVHARLDCVCVTGLLEALPAAVAKKLESLQLLNLDDGDEPGSLAKLSSLATLTLEAYELSPLLADTLASAPATLTSLSLVSTRALALKKVRLPESLARLELNTQQGVALPAKLPALTALTLFTAAGDVSGLEVIAKLSSLEELDLHVAQRSRLTLKGLVKLRTLRLVKLAAEGFEHLEALEELQLLLDEGQRFELSALAGLARLRQLYVSGLGPKVDLAPLAKLPALKVVNFSDQFSPSSAQLAPLAGRGIELRDSMAGSGPVDTLIAALKKKKR